MLYLFLDGICDLIDNNALALAAKEADNVIPCFIIDPRQVGNTNHYRSLNAIQFMQEALNDLAQICKLRVGNSMYGQDRQKKSLQDTTIY